MREFMRQQIGIEHSLRFIGEALLWQSVVAGLVMLEAFAANGVAQREEEVLGLIVARLVKCRGLAHQPRKRVERRRLDLDILRRLTSYVEVMLRCDLRRQRNLAKVAAGDEGRVDQGVDRDSLERS